jgi:hypothetical protein
MLDDWDREQTLNDTNKPRDAGNVEHSTVWSERGKIYQRGLKKWWQGMDKSIWALCRWVVLWRDPLLTNLAKFRDLCVFLCYLVPYSCLDPYTSHSDYRTILMRGFKLLDTANIQYSPRPYTYHKEYGHSRIWYSWQPYLWPISLSHFHGSIQPFQLMCPMWGYWHLLHWLEVMSLLKISWEAGVRF